MLFENFHIVVYMLFSVVSLFHQKPIPLQEYQNLLVVFNVAAMSSTNHAFVGCFKKKSANILYGIIGSEPFERYPICSKNIFAAVSKSSSPVSGVLLTICISNVMIINSITLNTFID